MALLLFLLVGSKKLSEFPPNDECRSPAIKTVTTSSNDMCFVGSSSGAMVLPSVHVSKIKITQSPIRVANLDVFMVYAAEAPGPTLTRFLCHPGGLCRPRRQYFKREYLYSYFAEKRAPPFVKGAWGSTCVRAQRVGSKKPNQRVGQNAAQPLACVPHIVGRGKHPQTCPSRVFGRCSLLEESFYQNVWSRRLCRTGEMMRER
jgi:hypothetical protein